MNRREMLGWLASAAAAGVGTTVGLPAVAGERQSSARGGRFAMGADVSTLLELEANGAKFYEHGERLDCLRILKDHGVDSIRIKVWNDPGNPNYFPANQSPAAGYNNAEHARVLARRAAALGMRVLIDFHYSDWWADPGKQYPPHEWAGKDIAQTCALLSEYTSNVLNDAQARRRSSGVGADRQRNHRRHAVAARQVRSVGQPRAAVEGGA